MIVKFTKMRVVLRRGSVSQSHLETQSNAYATINKLPMAPSSRRYCTIINCLITITERYEYKGYFRKNQCKTLEKKVKKINHIKMQYTY